MIFDLVRDFADVLDVMPKEHPRYRILKLFDEAIRRDAHFIQRHREDYPQALFQCLWNSGWWKDCSAMETHRASNAASGSPLLCELLEDWRDVAQQQRPGLLWLRSLRPYAQAQSQSSVFRGHTREVMCVCSSPDGTRIASGSLDRTVRVWDVETGREILCMTGHHDWVSAVTWSFDGKWIASASYDRTVRVWDAETGAPRHQLRHQGAVQVAAFSPRGNLLASGEDNGTILIWNGETGEVKAGGKEHTAGVECVAWSPESTWLISGGEDHAMYAWDIQTCLRLGAVGNRAPAAAKIQGHHGSVKGVSFSPRNHCFASGAGLDSSLGDILPDVSIKIWDGASGSEIRSLEGHQSDVTAVAFSSDGVILASGSWDRTIRLWNSATGESLAVLRGHQAIVRDVAWLGGGANRLISGGDDLTVRVWDLDADTEAPSDLADVDGRAEDGLARIAFSAKGDCILAQDAAGHFWEIKASTGERFAVVDPHTIPCEPVLRFGRPPTFGEGKHLETIVVCPSLRRFAWYPDWLFQGQASAQGNLVAGAGGDFIHLLAVEGAPEEPASVIVVQQPVYSDPAEMLNPAAFDADPNEISLALRVSGRIELSVRFARLALANCGLSGPPKPHHAVVAAGNLSEVLLLAGDIAGAVKSAREAVQFADKTGDLFHAMSKRTTLAQALDHAGEYNEARNLFQQAEKFQERMQPEYPLLNLLWGYRYCDFLLQQGLHEEVFSRAEKLLAWRAPTDSLINIALDHLVMGRAMFACGRKGNGSGADEALEHVNFALQAIRIASRKDWLPTFLLARTAMHLARNELPAAGGDLREVIALTRRGNMPLHEADAQLLLAKLHAHLGDATRARNAVREAIDLIENADYGRTHRELETVQNLIGELACPK